MRDFLLHVNATLYRKALAWLACACVFLGTAQGADAFLQIDDQGRSSISREELEELINRPGTTVVQGSVVLEEGEVREGHLVIIAGDLEMMSGSSVKGDAIVVSGDALLNGECVVEGDLRVVSGYLWASDKAEVRGRTLIHKGNYELESLDAESGEVELKGIKDVNRYRLGWNLPLGPIFPPGPFNRVDGHTFDVRARYSRPEGVRGSVFEATLRIPTEDTHEDFVMWRASLEAPLLEDESLKLSFEGFKWTETEDAWRTGDLENSLVAFVTSNDNRDYYEETGGAVRLGYRWTDELHVGGGLRSAECRSLATRSPFTLIQRTDFRENPQIDEGRLTEFAFGLRYDTRFDVFFPADAWYLQAGMRIGLDFLDGEHTYTMLEATARRHQQLTLSDFLDLRLKAAGAMDPLPAQRTYSLGSVGGVRGKDFESWASPRGDRLLLANVEYRRRLAPVRYIEKIFSTWWLVAFYDAGAVFLSGDPEDLGTLFSEASDHAGSGAGLGVSGSSLLPYVGIFAAKDLDTDSWRFIVRLNREF
jgi:hypothetical protein